MLGQYRCLTSPNGKSDGWRGQAGAFARGSGEKWAPQGLGSVHTPPVHPSFSEASSQDMPSWTRTSQQLVISTSLSIILFMVALNASFIVASLNVSNPMPFMLEARTGNL